MATGITAPEIAELTGLKRSGELEPHAEGVRVPLVARAAVA